MKDIKNCYIKNKEKNIAIISANNLAIISSGNSILIADKNRTSEVKKLFFEEKTKPAINFLGANKKV